MSEHRLRIAKVARFYAGSLGNVESLGINKFNDYWEAITVIEAQEMLLAMNVSAYPYMKKEDAKKFHRRITKLAYPKNEERTKRPLTSIELAQLLGAGVIKNGR